MNMAAHSQPKDVQVVHLSMQMACTEQMLADIAVQGQQEQQLPVVRQLAKPSLCLGPMQTRRLWAVKQLQQHTLAIYAPFTGAASDDRRDSCAMQ